MVWRCIGTNSVGDLIKIEENIICLFYVIMPYISSGRRLIGQNFIFMHDNDPKHTTRVYKDHLQHLEQNDESEIMH